MGKDLRGKELGVGISQRNDGLYTARYTDSLGRRKQKYFKKLQECRKWIADCQFAKEHGTIKSLGEMTVDAWYLYWIENIKKNSTKKSTILNYSRIYEKNIKPFIGDMLLNDIKPIHCQNILNQLSERKCTNSTIHDHRVFLRMLFGSAMENGLIIYNPVIKSVKCTTGMPSKEKRVLTIDEQKLLLNAALKRSSYYNQYALILQTGIRTGELIGLKWSDIDFEKNIMKIRRTMMYDYKTKEWNLSSPKTQSGNRDIPLTNVAVSILHEQRNKIRNIKIIPIQYSEYVFLNRNGLPTSNTTYDMALYELAKKIGIQKLSMHSLRHTFATRCIEAGMRPKTLQVLMGHSNIGMTMDLYVHVTAQEKEKEMDCVSSMLNVM